MDVRKISTLAMFIAISAVGAAIKIPSIVGSLALDSFPALIAGVLLGPISGGIVAGLGTLISAIISGMPLGPLHFIIVLEMFVLVWMFCTLYNSSQKLGAVTLFLVGNALIAPLPFMFIISTSFYIALLPSLITATVINVVIAIILMPKLVPVLKKMIFKAGNDS